MFVNIQLVREINHGMISIFEAFRRVIMEPSSVPGMVLFRIENIIIDHPTMKPSLSPCSSFCAIRDSHQLEDPSQPDSKLFVTSTFWLIIISCSYISSVG